MSDRMERQIEREEQDIEAAVERGEMTRVDANRCIRDLWRDYREAARDAARDAYDREMDNW
jgi:hypothetical protein